MPPPWCRVIMMQNAEAKALQQLLQLNDQSVEAEGKMQTGDRVARSSSHEPTYVVIKDDAPVVLKPWARTPTPSPLLRRSRPQSSLEKWCYNEVDRQQQATWLSKKCFSRKSSSCSLEAVIMKMNMFMFMSMILLKVPEAIGL